MQVLLKEELQELYIITVWLTFDQQAAQTGKPPVLKAFHCINCGQIVTQYDQYTIKNIVPGVCEKPPTYQRCIRCKQYYVFQAID